MLKLPKLSALPDEMFGSLIKELPQLLIEESDHVVGAVAIIGVYARPAPNEHEAVVVPSFADATQNVQVRRTVATALRSLAQQIDEKTDAIELRQAAVHALEQAAVNAAQS